MWMKRNVHPDEQLVDIDFETVSEMFGNRCFFLSFVWPKSLFPYGNRRVFQLCSNLVRMDLFYCISGCRRSFYRLNIALKYLLFNVAPWYISCIVRCITKYIRETLLQSISILLSFLTIEMGCNRCTKHKRKTLMLANIYSHAANSSVLCARTNIAEMNKL